MKKISFILCIILSSSLQLLGCTNNLENDILPQNTKIHEELVKRVTEVPTHTTITNGEKDACHIIPNGDGINYSNEEIDEKLKENSIFIGKTSEGANCVLWSEYYENETGFVVEITRFTETPELLFTGEYSPDTSYMVIDDDIEIFACPANHQIIVYAIVNGEREVVDATNIVVC